MLACYSEQAFRSYLSKWKQLYSQYHDHNSVKNHIANTKNKTEHRVNIKDASETSVCLFFYINNQLSRS